MSALFTGRHVYLVPDRIGPARLNILKNNLRKHGAIVMTTLTTSTAPLIVLVDDAASDQQTNELKRHMDASKDTMVSTRWLTDSVKDNVAHDLNAYRLDTTSPPTALVELDDSDEPTPEKKPRRFVCEYSSKSEEQKPTADMKLSTSTELDDTKPVPLADTKPSPTSAAGIMAQNTLIVSQLKILSDGSRSTNQKWRALAYDKAIKQIERIDTPITSREQVRALPGVGAKIADKICEIMATGHLRKADAMSQDEHVQTMQLFNDIWGVGPTKANEWYQLGYRTLDDICTKARLTHQQQIGVKHFEDILKRMPRAEATQIAATVIGEAHAIDGRLVCTTCGSYRRGKADCGDVDVLITHPDGTSHGNILADLVTRLTKSGFLTDHLIHCTADGRQSKYMGVCRLPGDEHSHRRIDIITVPYTEYATALVYFTGSAHFTRSIYAKAKARGWRLNQHGMRAGVMRAAGDTLNEGYAIETPTEESVFAALGLAYLTPEQRDHL